MTDTCIICGRNLPQGGQFCKAHTPIKTRGKYARSEPPQPEKTAAVGVRKTPQEWVETLGNRIERQRYANQPALLRELIEQVQQDVIRTIPDDLKKALPLIEKMASALEAIRKIVNKRTEVLAPLDYEVIKGLVTVVIDLAKQSGLIGKEKV